MQKYPQLVFNKILMTLCTQMCTKWAQKDKENKAYETSELKESGRSHRRKCTECLKPWRRNNYNDATVSFLRRKPEYDEHMASIHLLWTLNKSERPLTFPIMRAKETHYSLIEQVTTECNVSTRELSDHGLLCRVSENERVRPAFCQTEETNSCLSCSRWKKWPSEMKNKILARWTTW